MRRAMRLAVLATMAAFSPAHAQVATNYLVWDSETGRPLGFPGAPGRNFVGEPMNLAPNTGLPATITQMDTILVSGSATAYTDLRLFVTFWNTASNATSGATPAFSSSLGTFGFDFGAFTTAASTGYFVNGLTLANGPTYTSLTNVGITINWEGDTGAGLVSTDNLTSSVGNAPVAIGSVSANGGNGYYRNGSGETDGNFPGTDFHTAGGSSAANPSAIAFRLYAPVPEPGTLALCGLAGCGVLGRLWRRRRAG